MTSTRRAEANLRNAASSTGPRTLSGRSRSRLNAVTHGLTAETLILPGEDPRAFQRRLEKWTAELAPAYPFEQDLVHPRMRQPREYIGGRSEGRRKEIPDERKYKFRRCSPEKAERIAIRAIRWLAEMGLALLIAACLGTTAGAPASDRPEDSALQMHPVILDGAPDHPVPGHPGLESLFLPLESGLQPSKWAKGTQRWGGCADCAGDPASGRPAVGPVARPSRSTRPPLIGRTSRL